MDNQHYEDQFLQLSKKQSERYWKKFNENMKNEEFNDVVKPVMKYLSENHSPHTVIMIDSGAAELLEGVRSFTTQEFIKD